MFVETTKLKTWKNKAFLPIFSPVPLLAVILVMGASSWYFHHLKTYIQGIQKDIRHLHTSTFSHSTSLWRRENIKWHIFCKFSNDYFLASGFDIIQNIFEKAFRQKQINRNVLKRKCTSTGYNTMSQTDIDCEAAFPTAQLVCYWRAIDAASTKAIGSNIGSGPDLAAKIFTDEVIFIFVVFCYCMGIKTLKKLVQNVAHWHNITHISESCELGKVWKWIKIYTLFPKKRFGLIKPYRPICRNFYTSSSIEKIKQISEEF